MKNLGRHTKRISNSMLIKLSNSYGGLVQSKYKTKCFYCYTVYDSVYNMYYSGVKTNQMSNKACIGNKYFTSSSVTDFKERFIMHPNAFDIYVEYFESALEAFAAEKKYHNRYEVGKSKLFYNVIKSGGSNCGAGSVLCKTDDGLIYRVSCQEFKNNKHKHVSANLIHVYLKGDLKSLLTIDKDDFDANIHQTQFANHILCKDQKTNKNKRIPRDLFENDNRYVGITKGNVTAYKKCTDEKVTLSSDEYAKNKNLYYVKCIIKTVKVYDTKTKQFMNIPREEYHANKKRYKHNNHFHLNVYDIIERRKIIIDREEYDTNNNRYRKLMDLNGFIFKIDNIVFSNRVVLAKYLTLNYEVNLKLKWVQNSRLLELFPELQIIRFEDYKNGAEFENN